MLCICAGALAASLQNVKEALEVLSPARPQDAVTPISATRCLKLYLERLGALDTDSSGLQRLIERAFASGQFVSIHPSLLAAAAYVGYQEKQGLLPVWPWALADLTGWQGPDDNTNGFSTVVGMIRLLSQEA